MCMVFAGQDPAAYESETRSVRLHGHATSIRLERAFWQVIDAIAAEEGVTSTRFLSVLHDEVMALHGEARNFSSLLRCACLEHMRRQSGAPTASRTTTPIASRAAM
ncbi:MAG: DNA-binding protein [Rhodobacteraceae bacterium]|nr:MAG: DNA-binding protein [Paracoccaceae bacterium]